ncbi:MAG: SPOR domain-containing protein [Candidatus Omnitrophica bacterium]|nr:SPOR domain-containing protein [Candidatus Omnitrophota bacterium]MDD5042611.1 SPOR domain-containing protein [Candidatus Omnitrophota bacterium]MDD5500369.1 SPOR domain-containing protein [Candidatus Omnitrophota bacterium]
MAEKEDYLQSELFSQDTGARQYRPRSAGAGSLFTRIRGHEKVLLSAMALVLLSILSFSLGVERGKRLASTRAVQEQPGYTIQVAAFRNKGLALRHARALDKSGISPLIFAKGDYIILCVGKFSNQESAQPLLNQLQKTYASCRIRRL